ncbi:hypothetical protein ACFSGX_05800 [Sphingomonas arantia]|uniref:DUF1983 domain-containing protein n=1 Tax=Sphingomonas arantia TaxID=1460676 RepID=A0ABW4TUA1_9SPHN
MRVVTPSGESIALGTTETGATIGIIDYSRRVTDDFGVTTVVERGFARKMSVRLAVPSPDVDSLQRRLADLRATSALWVADERFASLQVQGFYKDFQVDLPGTSVSFCSMSIEGIASSAAAADAGGDPAPNDRASTLQLLQPATVTDAVLTVSSVPETDAPAWDAETTYPIGARVIRGSTHRIYESLAAGNLGNDPATPAGRWLDLGPTNRWAMFDQALGTMTTANGAIVVTLDAGVAGAIALLDVKAATVRVQALGYDRTVPAAADTITFLDLPAGPVNVRISGDGAVSVGTMLIGRCVGLGITEASPTAGITDFSRKVVDDFGEVTIVERAWAKKMTAKALIRTDALDVVANRIVAVRARPCLWIGQSGLDSLTIYGFFKDFSVEVADGVSKLSLSIEGLSKATKLAPIESAVDWEAVRDPTGTKPDDNATNTADPLSPFGPDGTVADAIRQVAAGAEAVAAAHDRIDVVREDADALEEQAHATIVAALQSTLLANAAAIRAEEMGMLAGQKVKLVLRQETIDRREGENTIRKTIRLLGVVSPDGSAFILDLDQVMISPTQSFAGRLVQLTADFQGELDSKASVTQLSEAVAGESEARALALQQVVAELDGKIDAKASVTDVQQAFVDQAAAVAEAIRLVQTDFGDALATRATVLQLQQAVATEQEARASDLSIVNARFRNGSPNLLDNPDFTEELDFWLSSGAGNWDVIYGFGVGTFVQTDDVASIYQDVSVQPGNAYSLSLEADPDDMATTNSTVEWINNAGQGISEAVRIQTDGWSRFASPPVVAPAAASKARVRLNNVVAGKTQRVTRVQFQQGGATNFQPSLGTKAGVRRLDRAIATESEARADALSEVTAELQGDIDSKASVTDLSTAIAGEQEARALDIESVEASIDGQKGRIDDLREVIVDADGAVSTKAVLSLDANGKVVGYTATNDGTKGDLVFSFDSVTFLKPDGTPLFVLGSDADGDGNPNDVYAPSLVVDTIKIRSVGKDALDFGSTGQMSLYDRAASNDNSQATFTGFMGVGIVSRDGSPMTGFVSFHAQNIGNPAGAAYYRIVRVQDGHVVWGGANGLPMAVSTVGGMMAWGFSDSVPMAAEAQYDVQVRCTGGANIRSSARHEEVTERVRTAFTQIWISAPPGEGPGAGAGGGGQINGDDAGDGGTTGTTTNNPSGVGGLRQKQFEEIP